MDPRLAKLQAELALASAQALKGATDVTGRTLGLVEQLVEVVGQLAQSNNDLRDRVAKLEASQPPPATFT